MILVDVHTRTYVLQGAIIEEAAACMQWIYVRLFLLRLYYHARTYVLACQ